MSAEACIFCRNNDMAGECWHSPEYEYVARAFARAFLEVADPTDEQVGFYVDDAECVAADLRALLGKDTALEMRALAFLPTNPDLAAVLVNDRLVVTAQSVQKSGEPIVDVVADLGVTP